MYSRMFIKQFAMGLKLYLRVPIAIFWLIAFPVVLLLGLGFAIGTDPAPKLVWAAPAPLASVDQTLRHTIEERGLRVELLPPAEAETRWQQGRMPLLLEGVGGHYTLRFNSYFATQAAQTAALVQEAFMTAQARAAGIAEPERIPVERSSPGGHRDGPYAGYLLPGLMGLNLVMMGLFNVGMVDVTLRAKGGYKRLAATPLPRFIYLAAQVAVRLTVVLIAAMILMSTGYLAFGVRNQGSYASVLALLILGTTCFNSLGYVLASFVRNVEGYGGLSNLVFLPLMLLSGVYFSLDSAPDWLQHGASYLPLAPLLTALRAVFNDGASLASQGRVLAILSVWTVLLFVLATRRFRWV